MFSPTRRSAGPTDLDELQQYVNAFSRSSDRARWALYVVVIATALIGIANWNVQEWGWPRRRMDKWFPDSAVTRAQSATPAPGRTPASSQAATVHDRFLEIRNEEYVRQFASRALLPSSPIPGVYIDVNDMGVLGGGALVLLMWVLVLCLDREHENLYLALYKVRRLCDEHPPEASPHPGDTPANLLYHALAMGQVLSSPPTLAQWGRRALFHRIWIVFFFPALIYGWLVITNLQTGDVALKYQAPVFRLAVVQVVLGVLIVSFSVHASLTTRAMGQRWERMFFRINPRRRMVSPMSGADWLRLRWPWLRRRSEEQGKLITELVDTIEKAKPETIRRTGTTPTITHVERVPGSVLGRSERVIHRGNMERMTRIIERQGVKLARKWCEDNEVEFVGLRNFNKVLNRFDGSRWEVAGKWTFRYR
ncbi:MAG TPA: hypothetical protein VF092_00935 [Longimicrobium sp.]